MQCPGSGSLPGTVSSTATVPGDPGVWLQGWAMKGAPWVAAVNQPTNQPRALDSAKALWILTRLGLAEGGLRDGTAAGLPPGECYGRPLNMSVRLDAFPSSQGEGNGNPLQYSCLENPRDGGAWYTSVHGVSKSQTWLSDFTFTFHFHALEKEMATHFSVLPWRITGTGEPGGLLSMELHRVGHDWSDLAAAAAVSSQCFIVSKWAASDLGPRGGWTNVRAVSLIIIALRVLGTGIPLVYKARRCGRLVS